MTASHKTVKIIVSMIKFFMTSVLLRVAIVQTVLIAGGLYFVAHQFTPDATYVTDAGQVRHVFLSPGFVRQTALSWLMLLPVSYLVTKFVMWVTGKKP